MIEPDYLRPSAYARRMGVSYRTILNQYYAGEIPGMRDATNHILLQNPFKKSVITRSEHDAPKAVLYARVSSTVNKQSLDGQIERMREYAAARGYNIIREEREIASGLDDKRQKLNIIRSDDSWDVLIVEHRDRLTRFGWGYFSILNRLDQRVESINNADNKDQEIVDDLISIITSFCGKIYGSNRKKKTMRIINDVKNEDDAQ